MTISLHKKRILNGIFKKHNNETFKSLVAKQYKEFKNTENNANIDDFKRYVNCNCFEKCIISLDVYDYNNLKDVLNINDIQYFDSINEKSFNEYIDERDVVIFKDFLENCLYHYYIDEIEKVINNRYCF